MRTRENHVEKDTETFGPSVNVELPPEAETFIAKRVAAAEARGEIEVWTLVIHEALWKMRNSRMTREELRAELENELVAALDSPALPGEQVMARLRKRLKTLPRKLKEARNQGLIGNLLLPEQLHIFIAEEVARGAFPSPTEVVVEALRRLETGDA